MLSVNAEEVDGSAFFRHDYHSGNRNNDDDNYFWEPHTSSVDFCEHNYLHSNYIVEFHNTWSSLLGITLFGIIGIIAANPLKETRFNVAYNILIFIGIGSAGLHGSLHWIFQSSDELPMVYLATCINYMIFECNDAPIGQPRRPWLSKVLIVACVIYTFIYYYYQEIYLVFLVSYSLEIAILNLLTLYYVLLQKRRLICKRLAIISLFSYVLIGLPVWIFDMLLCHRVIPTSNELPSILQGATPHIIWHFTAGYGAYCIIACLCCCRMEDLKIPFRVDMIGGIIPVISTSSTKIMTKNSINGKKSN